MSEIDTTTYQQIFDFPVERYYQRLGFDFIEEPFEKLAIQYCKTYDSRVKECDLHSDAINTVAEISKRSVSQSILSSLGQSSLERALQDFGLIEYFDEVVGLENVHAAGKIETGRTLTRRLGVDPAKMVLIGDTIHDHEVASELGVDCILVAHGHHSKQRLQTVHELVIDSLGGLS